MIIFFIIFTILFSWLAIKHLDWALQFLIFALPAYLIRTKILVPITLLEVMIWVVFLVWAYKARQELKSNFVLAIIRREKKTNLIKVDYPFKWEIVLLLIISFVSAAVAGFNTEALGIWKAYFFEPILFFIVVLNVIGKSEKTLIQKIEKIIWPLVWSALAVSLLSVYQKFTGQFIPNPLWAAAATRRVTSFFGYPNAVGLYLEGIILLMAGYLPVVIARSKATWQSRVSPNESDASEKKLKIDQPEIAAPSARNDKIKIIVLLLTILLSILSIIFAKSVGASLGVGVGLVVFALLINKPVRRITLIVLVVGLIVMGGYQPVRHVALKYLTLNDFSGQVRRAQWSETLTMLKDQNHWLLGMGLANYQAAVSPYHQPGFFVENYDDPRSHNKLVFDSVYRAAHWQPLEIFVYPHNIILNFWTELGLAGLLLFVWLIFKFLYFGFKALKSDYRPMVAALIAIMIALVVHGLVDVPYFKNDLSVLFWLWLAVLGMIGLENKQRY